MMLSHPIDPKTLDSIDWSRMIEPQPDGYDSDQVIRLSEIRGALSERDSISRPPPSFLDEKVSIFHYAEQCPIHPYTDHGPLSGSTYRQAEQYLGYWPHGIDQCKRLVRVIHPMDIPSLPEAQRFLGAGSSSHSGGVPFGVLFATVFDPMGFSQAIVHETAHMKLRMLGVQTESKERFILNSQEDVFNSPIVGTLRPITAIFHATLALTYMLQLNLHGLTHSSSETEFQAWLKLSQKNRLKADESFETVSKHGRFDSNGSVLWCALTEWYERVTREIKLKT